MKLQLGVHGVEALPATVDLGRRPHGLVIGETGSGKSYLVNKLIAQANAQDCTVIVADPKDAGDFVSSEPTRLARGPHESVQVVEQVALEMRDLPGTTLLVVDELAAVGLRLVGESARDAKDRVERLHAALGTCCLMGRAFGLRLLLLTQRADASAFGSGAIRDNCSWRVALGWLSPMGYSQIGFPSDLRPPEQWPGVGWVAGISDVPPGRPSILTVGD